MLTIDHIVLSSTNLARDAAALEERLGVPLSEGGKHALFGTHNKLLRLGDLYLELIATDVGCTLEKFVVSHPHAISLRSFLSPLHSDPRVDVRGSEVPSFHATLKTPKGTVTLTS